MFVNDHNKGIVQIRQVMATRRLAPCAARGSDNPRAPGVSVSRSREGPSQAPAVGSRGHAGCAPRLAPHPFRPDAVTGRPGLLAAVVWGRWAVAKWPLVIYKHYGILIAFPTRGRSYIRLLRFPEGTCGSNSEPRTRAEARAGAQPQAP